MKSKIFIFFISILVSSGLDVVLKQNELASFSLSYEDPAYLLDELTLVPIGEEVYQPAVFCKLNQPKYEFTYYQNAFDQTDSSLFLNQTHFLVVDSYLIVVLNQGIVQQFSLEFGTDDTLPNAVLTHLNEVNIKEPLLQKELEKDGYIALFYLDEQKSIVIVSSYMLSFYNIYDGDKSTWFQHRTFEFNIDVDEIIYSKTVGQNLFVLRKNNILEIWDLSNTQSVKLLNKFNFTSDFNYLNNPKIIDFEIDGAYFAFLEENKQTLYSIKYNGNILSINKETPNQINLRSIPKRIEIIKGKFFVLEFGLDKTEYSLMEFTYELNLTKTYHVGLNFTDLFVGENYFLLTYPEYALLQPHTYVNPFDANSRLQNVLNVKYLNYAQPFVISSSSPSENPFRTSSYFSLLRDFYLQFSRVNFVKAQINCNGNNVKQGVYYLNITSYHVKCKDIDFNCDTTQNYNQNEVFTFTVKPADEISVYDNITSQPISLIVGTTVGFGLGAFLIFIICCLYVRRVKKKYQNLLEKKGGEFNTSKDYQGIRVQSKEEVDANMIISQFSQPDQRE